MHKFKDRWEITQNWQLIHPILGVFASIISGFLIARRIQSLLPLPEGILNTLTLLAFTVLFTYLIVKVSLWCFKKLENKWQVQFRWEFIAIFLCFAVTGSTAGRVSNPLMEIIGLSRETTTAWLYWPVRILLIFPVYQVLLLVYGWIFGQYAFFKSFAIKMISSLGLGFLFSKY